MNKVLIVILVLGAAGLVYYLVGGDRGIPFETDTAQEVDTEAVREALQETGKRTVYGSCNDIAESSTCVDYVGSMWNDNNMAELNCEGVGAFSKNTCPYSDFGGCQTNGGTVMEIIAWAYKEGSGGYTDESVVYASMSCNSLPNAQWVTPSDLLE